jgi:GNAT superfamily N-acetyltransferase
MKYTFLVIFILLILLILILAFIINNALSKKLILGGDTDSIDTKYYYSIYNGDIGLVYDELKILLAQYNFHEEPLTKHVHVSFGSLSSKDIYGNDNAKQHMINGRLQWWDPLFLKQKAVIKNTLGGHKSLSEKVKLYETIKKLVPIGIKHIPKTYTINEFETKILNKLIDKSNAYANVIYILKKNQVNKQKGVSVFSEKNEYMAIKKELDIKPHNGIIMEYITNPALTVDGKKFHLRMYALLIIESGIKRCYIHNESEILTAKEKYKKSDWLNKYIHISCGSTTDRAYKFPDDIAIPIDNPKFNEFKKTLSFAVAFNDSIIYEENQIGYHIYGVDVLMTNDNNFFILEFNGYGLGFGCSNDIKNTPECDLYKKQFSKNYFSFILNSTVFSVFGLKRRPIPYAEVCSTGVLSPFFNILTGANRCTLIPYLDALPNEIDDAKKIYFHNESIQLKHLLKICNLHNVFLIGINNTKDSDQPRDSEILRDMQLIGYLTLDHDNYLIIVIIKEYQNRGIATAMIAQFLEIYAHRHISTQNDKIHMLKQSIFIDNIAKKLHFILEKNSSGSQIYTRGCRIKDTIIKKVNNYELLTYNIIKENNGITNIAIFISKLDKYMVSTKSQFVHLAYSEVSHKTEFDILKASTGSKYDTNFITQGSELKSTLDLKNTQIKIYKDYIDDASLYRTYAKYKPYLYNGYRIDIQLYFFLYISKNGIKKCYYMDNIIVKKSDILFEDELEKNKNYTMYMKDSDLQYKWPDTFLNDDKIGDIARGFFSNEKINNCLNLYIEEIADSIIQSDASSYNESNSGFNIINVTIDFTEKENKYVPQIRNLFMHTALFNNININDKTYKTQFSDYYYDFLINNIINPHFGLSSGQFMLPLKCIVNTELHVDATVISKLNLQFNKHRNKIDIYLISTKIGHIDLNIDDIDVIVLSHIELSPSYRKKNIAVNVLFILMEILAAYYAPLNISLKMAFVKPMFQIAHTLQFHKSHWHSGRPMHDKVHSIKEEEYFIRLCRI